MSFHFRRLLLVTTVIALFVLGCSNPVGDDDDTTDVHPKVDEFVTVMNDHREAQGLSRLVWDNDLANVAERHSQDMHDRAFFSHTNPDGDDPFDRMSAAGISYQSTGENIAQGYTTGQAVFDGWINSSGHRANIENGSYTHHGVGYVEDGNYWTHVFAQNPSTD